MPGNGFPKTMARVGGAMLVDTVNRVVITEGRWKDTTGLNVPAVGYIQVIKQGGSSIFILTGHV